jgi:hypothetical protein
MSVRTVVAGPHERPPRATHADRPVLESCGSPPPKAPIASVELPERDDPTEGMPTRPVGTPEPHMSAVQRKESHDDGTRHHERGRRVRG